MPADILRDRDTQDAPSFADIATATPDLPTQIRAKTAEIDAARTKREEAAGEEKAAMETANVERKRQLAETRDVLTAPRPAPPAVPALPPQPPHKLNDFLAPVQGEAPENTIGKLIQAVGILATGFTGLARGDAKSALSSLKGALEGWHTGDKERADRDFAAWKASSDALIKDWEMRHRTYRDIMENADLTMDQQLKLLELKGVELGHDVAVKTFARQDATANIGFLTEDRNQLMRYQELHERLLASSAEKRRHEEFLLELKRQGAQQKSSQDQSMISQYTPEALKALGQQWVMTGKLPSGVGVGKAGAIVKGMVTKAGIEWAKEQGLEPMEFPAIQAEVKSTQGALATVKRMDSVQQAAVKRLDGHLDALLKLSDMVPRSEIVAVNRAILAGERDYKGSPEAAAYVFQAFEASMEFARVVVPGNAQGDASTRDEARKALAPALANGQVKAVVAQMRQNAERNIESNRASEKELSKFIDTIGGRTKGSSAMFPPPPTGTADDPLGILTKAK